MVVRNSSHDCAKRSQQRKSSHCNSPPVEERQAKSGSVPRPHGRNHPTGVWTGAEHETILTPLFERRFCDSRYQYCGSPSSFATQAMLNATNQPRAIQRGITGRLRLTQRAMGQIADKQNRPAMGSVIGLYRIDSANSPRQNSSKLRVPPVVGHGRPVRLLKREGGILA